MGQKTAGFIRNILQHKTFSQIVQGRRGKQKIVESIFKEVRKELDIILNKEDSKFEENYLSEFKDMEVTPRNAATAFSEYFRLRYQKTLAEKYRRLLLFYTGVEVEKWSKYIHIWKAWESEPRFTELDPDYRDKPQKRYSKFPDFSSHGESHYTSIIKYRDILTGMWTVYIRNNQGIKKTYCNILANNLVQYRSIHDNEFIMEGNLFAVSKTRFFIELEGNERNFSIYSRISDQSLSGSKNHDILILPSCGIVYYKEQINSNPIILYKDPDYNKNSSEKDFYDTQVTTLNNENCNDNDIDKLIGNYLGYKKQLFVDYFTKNEKPIERYIKKNLKRLGRSHQSYKLFKSRLEGNNKGWVSISRILERKNELAIYRWEFTFDDVTQRCFVERFSDYETGETYYKGEAKIFDNHMWIVLKSEEGKHKFFYCHKKDLRQKNDLVIFGLGSSIRNGAHMVKEMLITRDQLGKKAEKTIFNKSDKKGVLDYTTFKNKIELPYKLRIQLANRDDSILTYPDVGSINTKLFRQWRAANRYKGKYFIYIINKYRGYKEVNEGKDRKPNYLFRFTLEIDELGIANLEKQYNDNQTVLISSYQGIAEHLNQTLRIVLEHHPETDGNYNRKEEDKRQFCEIKLHATDTNRNILVGLISDTDRSLFPDCSSCIMVQFDKLPFNEGEFLSDEIPYKEKSKELDNVLRLMKKNYGGDFKKNFGKTLKSIHGFFEQTGGVYFHNYQ